ncbi:unnamed protein product [Meganyctiphanes norvegica]|uniref:Uncharacterized protein n=1 Tax=Meganyctiphanes norvegica TaxID=48144 RepID=A0AAV2SV71_MEGNR
MSPKNMLTLSRRVSVVKQSLNAFLANTSTVPKLTPLVTVTSSGSQALEGNVTLLPLNIFLASKKSSMSVSGNATGIFLGMIFLSNSFGKRLAVPVGNFSDFCQTPMVSPGTLGLGLDNQEPLKSHEMLTFDVEALP